jgi:magnesium transporter
MEDRNKVLVESIKRLLRRNATSHLRKIVNKTHAADLARLFRSLPLAHQHTVFNLIDEDEQKGILFSEMDEDTFLDFIQELKIDEMVTVLEDMASDDVADLIERMPDETADLVLKKMKQEGSEEVESLLGYEKDSAGGIMTPDFIALPENITAKEAVKSIQKEHLDVEMPFYLYVVDENQKLVGVSSLRQLVVSPPETSLKELMTADVFSVRTHTDQEEVAKLVARYDLLAVPVVDDTNSLVGIVTVDDVIDIIKEEATEDILRMAGAGAEFVETKSVLKSTRIRLPWLFASCLGGLLASLIIGHFEDSLTQVTFLAAFIPVIMGMGGNIGTQSSTIVVRGLSTGLLNVRDIGKVVGKELTIGFFLGIVYGGLIGTVAHFHQDSLALGISVGSAVISSMSVAALVGSLVPMLFARLNVDPAVATGPFVTTAIDIISVFFYFQIATLLLGL